MADKVRKVSYFYTMVPNRPGAGARVLRVLREARVNLLAFSGFPHGGRKSQLDFVPEDRALFLRAMRRAGIKSSARKTGFLVEGADRIGACAAIHDKLAKARINVTAMDALSARGGRYAAILWVKPKDVARAARVLGAK
jgi:hypothetical protein